MNKYTVISGIATIAFAILDFWHSAGANGATDFGLVMAAFGHLVQEK